MTTVLERMPWLACPACQQPLVERDNTLVCACRNTAYPILDGIPQLLGEPDQQTRTEIAVQDRVADEYEAKRYHDPLARRYHHWWTAQMLERVTLRGRLLDNGCGTGLLFRLLQDYDTSALTETVGLDLSQNMLLYAQKHCDAVVRGDSQRLPFQDGVFDVACCRSLLHHLPRPQQAIDELHRVLAPGGEAVFVDTNASLISRIPRWLANRGEHFSPDHQNLTRRQLQKWLTPRFNVENITFFGYVAYPLFGFPDILPLGRMLPARETVYALTQRLDATLARLPGIRTQGWGILVKAVKPA